MARLMSTSIQQNLSVTRHHLTLMAGAVSLVLLSSLLAQQVRGADSTQTGQDVKGLIAAGEYGAAADLAATDSGEDRNQLMNHVIDAQMQAGETATALATSPRITNSQDRLNARSRIAREQVNHGGASFQELIMLIQMVTGDAESWEDPQEGGGTVLPSFSGIHVDPSGVLSHQAREDRTGRVGGIGHRARQALQNSDIAVASPLRIVSLTRLEQEVARRLSEGKPAVDSMKNLAGLSAIQFVLIDQENKEILIGGPAEGWKYLASGNPIGLKSELPTLQLDDLITCLRTFDRNGSFGCSIDPRAENLKDVQEFVAASQSRGPLSPSGVRNWANKIAKILGPQDITVSGVPADSRVARVLVEADYRMKLIGLGKLKSNTTVPSYFDLLAKDSSLAGGSLDALRWWMTLQCEAVIHSPERTVFEIRGTSVKCLSENQFLTASGERISTGKAESINQKFAENFTANYDSLAKQDPVFADLKGIFDLALVAALIQNDHLDQKIEWDRGVFAANGTYKPARYSSPRQTDSVINHRVYHGSDVVLQVAGGVRADVQSIMKDSAIQQESVKLSAVAEKTKAPELPANRWWWDAK